MAASKKQLPVKSILAYAKREIWDAVAWWWTFLLQERRSVGEK